jgi:hypothetical protein
MIEIMLKQSRDWLVKSEVAIWLMLLVGIIGGLQGERLNVLRT